MAVVVLTAGRSYWGERSLRDALRLYFRGKIEIIKADESKWIHGGVSKDGVQFKIPAPLVVRLLDFVGYKIQTTKVRYSDEAVFQRDRNICQYWHYDEKGKRFKYRCSQDDRTIDHVIPKCRGGENSSFRNTVTCCRWHNVQVKRGHTPQEAGLELIRAPFEPRLNKGDMAFITFTFNPNNKAHVAYMEHIGMEFSHVV